MGDEEDLIPMRGQLRGNPYCGRVSEVCAAAPWQTGQRFLGSSLAIPPPRVLRRVVSSCARDTELPEAGEAGRCSAGRGSRESPRGSCGGSGGGSTSAARTTMARPNLPWLPKGRDADSAAARRSRWRPSAPCAVPRWAPCSQRARLRQAGASVLGLLRVLVALLCFGARSSSCLSASLPFTLSLLFLPQPRFPSRAVGPPILIAAVPRLSLAGSLLNGGALVEAQRTLDDDVQALLAFKRGGVADLRGWVEQWALTSPCSENGWDNFEMGWEGVLCTQPGPLGRVKVVKIAGEPEPGQRNLGLNCSVEKLASLTELEELDLSYTGVQGDISTLAALRELTTLRLHGTSVHGPIEPLADCKRLTRLDIFSTSVYGNVTYLEEAVPGLHGRQDGYVGFSSCYEFYQGSPSFECPHDIEWELSEPVTHVTGNTTTIVTPDAIAHHKMFYPMLNDQLLAMHWAGSDETGCCGCITGHVNDDEDEICHACPAGFSAEWRETECTQCPAGKESPIDGAPRCAWCEDGMMSTFFADDNTSTVQCVDCPYPDRCNEGRCLPGTTGRGCASCDLNCTGDVCESRRYFQGT